MTGHSERPEQSELTLAARAHRFSTLARMRVALNTCDEVGELFGQAAECVRLCLGFDRAVVLDCERGQLTANTTASLWDDRSERLRQAMLAAPIQLAAGTAEATVVRDGTTLPSATRARSALADQLALTSYVIAAISVEGRTLAVLVADRCEDPPDALDVALIAACADIVSVVVERIVIRARTAELSAEIRYLTESARALMTEATQAPICLPVAGNRGNVVFASDRGFTPATRLPDGEGALSGREGEIAAKLASGSSNREIAEQLFLAESTVKGAVARIMRKLDASNRAEAAVRYLQLSQPTSN
jgi:DNA-binding NarL/FixJ family response regulator